MTAPTYGKDKHGEVVYWPDKSFLSVKVPAPLEQFLERIAKIHPYLGGTPQDIAIHLIRSGIIDMMQRHGEQGWIPDHGRYARLKKGER